KSGERYVLTGELHTIDQLLDWICEFSNASRPRIKVPPRLALSFSSAKDWFERTWLPDRHPSFNKHSIRLLHSAKSASARKAKLELGWQPTSVRDALRQHVEWFLNRR